MHYPCNNGFAMQLRLNYFVDRGVVKALADLVALQHLPGLALLQIRIAKMFTLDNAGL